MRSNSRRRAPAITALGYISERQLPVDGAVRMPRSGSSGPSQSRDRPADPSARTAGVSADGRRQRCLGSATTRQAFGEPRYRRKPHTVRRLLPPSRRRRSVRLPWLPGTRATIGRRRSPFRTTRSAGCGPPRTPVRASGSALVTWCWRGVRAWTRGFAAPTASGWRGFVLPTPSWASGPLPAMDVGTSAPSAAGG